MMPLDPLTVTAGMFLSMLVLLLLGTPLTWSLTVVGVASAYWLWGSNALEMLVVSTYGVMDTYVLVALPLFIFMGLVLQRSGITDALFDMVHKLMGGVHGGLGIGTVVICALIAAMAGVSGAATVSLGVIALPAMLKRGYDKRLATGTIMAGGALGFLIPPSVVMIVYAFLARESVGQLFAAGLVPGLMLAAIYSVYIAVRCRLNPELGPAIAAEERVNALGKIKALKALILPGGLITLVLGLIIGGVTSPTEASAVGAGGALLCAFVHRNLTWDVLRYALLETTKIMGMMMWVMLAAVFFSKIYIGLGAGALVANLVAETGLSPMMILLVMLASYFVLGMFLDDFAIIFITIPLYIPVITALGFDPVWFAVLFILSMQSAYLTPPFGYNLFYMRAVAPPSVTTNDLYRAALPFIALQLIGLALVVSFPGIALWLPRAIFN
ncbi:TRAP transporter large permease [Aquibaculum sediminis]|uniref:TRAP transporter large permease n=1 Tax=Aquibaculum sediminis TaxID=3231907 RepID=UPI0034522461